jgi:uncharacterized protein YecT (DUF1311 family)
MVRIGSTVTLAAVGLVLTITSSVAERAKLDPRDVKAVQDCLNSDRAGEHSGEPCIGVVADPCIEDSKNQSTAGRVGCAERERVVWDHILNDTFRLLRENLDNKQNVKLRDMQRAWVTSHDRSCGFFYDLFQGTMAAPMQAYCQLRETARRAMFLKRFLVESAGR